MLYGEEGLTGANNPSTQLKPKLLAGKDWEKLHQTENLMMKELSLKIRI